MFADLMKSSKLGRKMWKGRTMKPKAHAGPRACGDGEWKSHARKKAAPAPQPKQKKAAGR